MACHSAHETSRVTLAARTPVNRPTNHPARLPASMPAATDVANSVDVAALAGVIILAAGVVTASRTLWTVSRKWTTFTDLLKRELTGWQDEATGEKCMCRHV